MPNSANAELTQSRSRIWLFAFLLVAVYTFVYAVGPARILPTQEQDAGLVASMAREALYTDGKGAYYLTAKIYALMQGWKSRAFVYIVGLFYIYLFIWKIRSTEQLVTASFLLMSPIVMFLALFMKDTFVAVLAISTLTVATSKADDLSKELWTIILYSIYGVAFRQYYLLIVAAFFGFRIYSKSGPAIRFILITSILAAAIVIPSHFYAGLQQSRDLYNLPRIGRGLSGARTAFLNIAPPVDLPSFILNYIYAFLQLNVPILFPPIRFNRIFLFLTVLVVGSILWRSRHFNDKSALMLKQLFISHIAVLLLFEPDLGSYLRHASSVFIYLAPTLSLLGETDAPRPSKGLGQVSNLRRQPVHQAETEIVGGE